MRRSKRLAWWTAYAVGSAAVLGGLAWTTVRVLRLEHEEAVARAENDRQATLRLALWRMDSWLAPRFARESAREQVPIIGVNRGSLGFLTTFSADESRAQFAELLRGSFQVTHRAMLECSTGLGAGDLALNDVLIKDAVNSRLVSLEVFADGELVTNYTCDGLIFSTPTGSTAYNLSAGGPIIHPAAGVIAMTPICPHTLSNRSIIFRENVCLRVFNRSPGARLLVAMDGQRNLKVGAQSPVEISISKLRLPLAQRADYSHFSVVRTKLKWSGGFVDKR